MRKKIIRLEESKSEFSFGNCAFIAIGSAFDIPNKSLVVICNILGINHIEGMSFWECKKLINEIAKGYNKKVLYKPNYLNLTYQHLAILFEDVSIIAMFPKHLSLCEKGTIYDTYMNTIEVREWKPTGYWTIN